MCAEINNAEPPPQSHIEWRHEPDIPYKIWCVFDCGDEELAGGSFLDRQHPARMRLTPDLSPFQKTTEYSLGIFLHHSIPKEFLDVVYFHEKTEAAAAFGDQHLEMSQAHAFSVEKTQQYAKQSLSPEIYQQFEEWQKTLNYQDDFQQ